MIRIPTLPLSWCLSLCLDSRSWSYLLLNFVWYSTVHRFISLSLQRSLCLTLKARFGSTFFPCNPIYLSVCLKGDRYSLKRRWSSLKKYSVQTRQKVMTMIREIRQMRNSEKHTFIACAKIKKNKVKNKLSLKTQSKSLIFWGQGILNKLYSQKQKSEAGLWMLCKACELL